MQWPRPRFVVLRHLFFLVIFSLLMLTPFEALGLPVALLQQVNHVAGTGASGYSGDGNAAAAAAVNLPQGVAVDGGGNLYIADTKNNVIRRVDATTGIITTVAGNGQSGYAGDGGLAAQAQLKAPQGIAVDAFGNLWIADTGNSVIRKVTAGTGIITTVAGDGTAGFGGDGLLATAATTELNLPAAVAVDAAGNLHIADTANNRIRDVTATTGLIDTYAGTGLTTYNGDGILATTANLSSPQGVALSAAGNLYLTDTAHNLVREVVTSTGDIQIVAGTAGQPGGFGGDGGLATSAELNLPTGLAFDTRGNLYISDSANARIREVIAGNISTLAGNGTAGFNNTDGALATTAELNNPVGLAVDVTGNIYVADTHNNAVRLISDGRHLPATALALATPVTRYLYLEINSALTLNTLSVSVGEEQKNEFSLSTLGATIPIGSLTACANSTAYSASTTCILPLAFAPIYPGAREAALSIATSAGTQVYGLSGIGQGPETVLSPGTIRSILPLLTTSPPNQPTYEQLAVDPQGSVYVADKFDNEISIWCAGVNTSNGCTGSNTHNIFVGSSSSGATVRTYCSTRLRRSRWMQRESLYRQQRRQHHPARRCRHARRHHRGRQWHAGLPRR